MELPAPTRVASSVRKVACVCSATVCPSPPAVATAHTIPFAATDGTRPLEILAARWTAAASLLASLLLLLLSATGLSQCKTEPSPSISVLSLAFYQQHTQSKPSQNHDTYLELSLIHI